jgi:DNA-binding HxlR family transcriptional regulator
VKLQNKPGETAAETADLSSFCPQFHSAVELIGRRWNGAILRAMLSGVNRFSDISGTVPGLSDKMLSERLKELERRGVLVRRVIPVTPVRIEYELTDKGRDLQVVVYALAEWAGRWPDRPARPRRTGARATIQR